MKSTAPWSVKGIERDARETAKEAARKEGLTVGEWLNQTIYHAGEGGQEIDGLKLKDIVTAVEHLARKVADAERTSADAVQDLARSMGGVVERVQRLERSDKPGVAGDPILEERLTRLEEKSVDRQRIDTLKALEKAVAQVALQFDTAHRGAIERLDANERHLKTLAERIEEKSTATGTGVDAETLNSLRTAIEGMSGRIARAEKIAADAARMKAEASEAADAEFVERTGKRLRVLGDEIKRGGDQIRALETSIDRLSDQIDAAERRSSEGVQKVSETIADLREQLLAEAGRAAATPKAGNAAIDATALDAAVIDAAVRAATAKTDKRISALQGSLALIVDKLERQSQTTTTAPTTASPQQSARTEPTPFPNAASPESISARKDAADELSAQFEQSREAELNDLHAEIEQAFAEINFDDDSVDVVDTDWDGTGVASSDDARVDSAFDAAFDFGADKGVAEEAPAARVADTPVDDQDVSADDSDDDFLADFDDFLDDNADEAADEGASGVAAGSPVAAPKAGSAAGPGADDDFDFDTALDDAADDAESENEALARSVIEDVRAAFTGEPAPARPAPAQNSVPAQSEEDIEAALAAFEDFETDDDLTPAPAAPGRPAPEADADAGSSMAELMLDTLDVDEEIPPFGRRKVEHKHPAVEQGGLESEPEGEPTDFIKAARAKARQAAAAAAAASAAETQGTEQGTELGTGHAAQRKRTLTPRQKALLAAKKRKRLEAEAAARAPAAELAPVREDRDDEKPSPLAKIRGAVGAVISKRRGLDETDEPAVRKKSASLASATGAGRAMRHTAAADKQGGILALARSRPITIVLVAGIILTLAALFFLLKDTLFGGGRNNTAITVAPSSTERPITAQPTATVPTPADAGADATIDPRQLYFDAMAALDAAITDRQMADAIAGLEQAAALGNPPAQLELGGLYNAGRGVEQDADQARLWYERAANGGNVLAMHRLGVMAARGEGGPVDLRLSVEWFEKAGNFGLVDSQFNLGATYHPSASSAAASVQNREKAYYWYLLADQNGDDQAGELARGVGDALTPETRRRIADEVSAWVPTPIDRAANERP